MSLNHHLSYNANNRYTLIVLGEGGQCSHNYIYMYCQALFSFFLFCLDFGNYLSFAFSLF